MKKKLFIFDLDGTALIPGKQPYARLPDFFSEFLDVISQKGWMWGINSTWDVNGQWHLVLVSSVKSRPSFLIGELGFRIARVRNSRLEFLQPYTKNMEKKVRKINEKELYPVMHRICSRFRPVKMYFYGHLFDFMVENKEKDAFEKLTIKSKNLIIKKSDGRLVAYPSILNKGNPIKEIMKITGLSPKDIVVAGDEPIDIPMMSPTLSKNVICPSNAGEEVKRHVKEIGGIISKKSHSEGVIEGFKLLFPEIKIT